MLPVKPITDAMVVLFTLGAVTPLVAAWRRSSSPWILRISLALAALGACLGVALGVSTLASVQVAAPVRWGDFRFVYAGDAAFVPSLYVDRLSALMLIVTGFIAAAVALYSCVWLDANPQAHSVACAYNLLVLFALLLLIVNNVYSFLLLLECMTLAFAFLTLYRHNKLLIESHPEDDEVRDARLAFQAYLIFSHVGVIFITAAFLLLALHASPNLSLDVSFDQLRQSQPGSNGLLAGAIFLLALLGFGLKAATIPFQSWMGLTHPYLPTSVHALVSSAIVKVAGLYGLIRVLFEFLPTPPQWWGCTVVFVAGTTALVGVFYAITSRDLKTGLANHSVENIGIILAGLGLALLMRATPTTAPLASLALLAALYHLVNHAMFKSLLFLGVGAIEHATGTVQNEELGGLIHTLPLTSLAFLIGSAAIAGFPPLNGFVSEWLTFQSAYLYLSVMPKSEPLPLLVAALFLALLMLAAAVGLTALAFVKIAGEALLGRPRTDARPRCGDQPIMVGVMLVLAGICVVLGVVPGWAASRLLAVAQSLPGVSPWPVVDVRDATQLALSAPTLAGPYHAQISMVSLLVVAAVPLALALIIAGTARLRQTKGPVWNCGAAYRPASMQITGGAFAFLAWDWAGGRKAEGTVDGEHADPEGKARVREPILPWKLPLSATYYASEYFRRGMDAALQQLAVSSTWFGEWFQGGDVRRYLAYLFVAFVLTLVVLLSLKPALYSP